MQYMVMGVDGKEYGPVSYDDLKVWVSENRLTPQTQVRDFNSGATMVAQAIPGLFPNYSAPAPMAAGPQAPQYQAKDDMGPLWGVIIRSILAVAVFFFLHGLGLFFAGYALYYAIQIQSSGSKYGVIAILIAVAALGVVGLGWLMRLQGAGL